MSTMSPERRLIGIVRIVLLTFCIIFGSLVGMTALGGRIPEGAIVFYGILAGGTAIGLPVLVWATDRFNPFIVWAVMIGLIVVAEHVA